MSVSALCQQRDQGLKGTNSIIGGAAAVEVRRGLAPSVSRGFHAACADLRPARRFVFYPGAEVFPLGGEIEALPVETLMDRLAARKTR